MASGLVLRAFVAGSRNGEVTEWLKVDAWKACLRAKPVPRVRIPLAPPCVHIIHALTGQSRLYPRSYPAHINGTMDEGKPAKGTVLHVEGADKKGRHAAQLAISCTSRYPS